MDTNKAASGQLDLFAKNHNYSQPKTSGGSFLLRFKLYEKSILVVIGFIVTAIIAFAWGVEQGKRVLSLSAMQRFDTASRAAIASKPAPAIASKPVSFVAPRVAPAAAQKYTAAAALRATSAAAQKYTAAAAPWTAPAAAPSTTAAAAPSTTAAAAQPVKTPALLQGYTIQIASYKSRDLAQKEVDSLRKKGYAVLVLAKGGYTVLCVGNFSNKQNAKVAYADLAKKYPGCILRRI
jgi:cell division septation protein DedD